MPDLFTSDEPKDRDARFRDGNAPKQASVTPSPVEPMISEEAEIPIAPTLRKPKYTGMHIFTSYSELPRNVTFVSQAENEKILIFLRRSLITNIGWVSVTIILVLVPFLLRGFLPSIILKIPLGYIIIGLLFYFLLVVSHFFLNFITWYFNIVLFTDKRILDIDFEELVYKHVSETKLDLVQDVSYTQTGVIRTFADYGDVLIQTAGTVDNFDIPAIPNPERVVNIIEDLIGRGREQGV